MLQLRNHRETNLDQGDRDEGILSLWYQTPLGERWLGVMGRRWTVARWRCSWCIFVVLSRNRFCFISYTHLTCSSFLDCYQFLSLSALQQDRLLLECIKISKQTKLRITRPSPVIETMVEIQNLVLDSWSKARTFVVNQKESIEYISPGKSIRIKNWSILKYITSKTKNVDQF